MKIENRVILKVIGIGLVIFVSYILYQKFVCQEKLFSSDKFELKSIVMKNYMNDNEITFDDTYVL